MDERAFLINLIPKFSSLSTSYAPTLSSLSMDKWCDSSGKGNFYGDHEFIKSGLSVHLIPFFPLLLKEKQSSLQVQYESFSAGQHNEGILYKPGRNLN